MLCLPRPACWPLAPIARRRYYELPFCKPTDVKKESENLGEILAGDRIESSDYELFFGKKESCKLLCRREITNKQAKKFSKYIEQEYTAHWYVPG